jgi:serine-type D-Ala-D-Ala carboxypeptidase (penicillin-binding protein 5/6)
VVSARNARAGLPMASITKLMTVLVTLEHARLDDVVSVDSDAVGVTGSGVRLRAGERLTVRDLVAAALVQSANDAAIALADYVGHGDRARFVAMMNRRAKQLGLRGTHFVRPDGLDAPGHVSSARDVTKLARVAMNNAVVRAVVRQRDAEAAGRSLHTWNDLLGSFPGAIGVKTGHTRGAGWSQVAAARGRGLTIYATVLGSPSRAQRNSDLVELLAWGLSRYRVVSLVRTGRVYARVDTPYDRPDVRLVAERPLVRVVRVGRSLTERVVAPTAVELPVAKGARLGEVQVWQGPKLVGRRALVAAEAVEKPGLAARARWYAGRTLRNAWGIFS